MPFDTCAENSGLIRGIDAHNALVFDALPSTRRVTMAVRTGAKVFDDIAFWRHISSAEQATQLDIILMDPDSPDLADIEREDYPDKPKGFLQQEVAASIEGIRNAQRALGMPDHIRYFLTKHRTPHRVTILDDKRVVAAPY